MDAVCEELCFHDLQWCRSADGPLLCVVNPIPHEPWAIYHPTIITTLKVWFRRPSGASWGLFAQSSLVYGNVEVRFIVPSPCLSFPQTPCTCTADQRALVLYSNNLRTHGAFALICCPFTKAGDYSPCPCAVPLCTSRKLLFLKWYKSDNWVALRWGVDGEGEPPSGWILLNGSVPLRLPIPSLSFSLCHYSPSYPCGVTRITSFSPNGHFAWQVHYTFLFPDCLNVANAWQVDCLGLVGRERAAACARALGWKTLITVFVWAWLRPLKGKILPFWALSLPD